MQKVDHQKFSKSIFRVGVSEIEDQIKLELGKHWDVLEETWATNVRISNLLWENLKLGLLV